MPNVVFHTCDDTGQWADPVLAYLYRDADPPEVQLAFYFPEEDVEVELQFEDSYTIIRDWNTKRSY